MSRRRLGSEHAARPRPLSSRAAGVVALLFDYGQVEGAHHKAWVIDQALREATGSPGAYLASVRVWEQTNPGCEWDVGVAP
jgi:hypothetical protein